MSIKTQSTFEYQWYKCGSRIFVPESVSLEIAGMISDRDDAN